MKAVDILPSLDDTLQLIGVKDFRGAGIQNFKKQKSGRLIIDVSKKLVDTFAALESFHSLLCDPKNRRVDVILFLERDDPETMLKRHKLTLASIGWSVR